MTKVAKQKDKKSFVHKLDYIGIYRFFQFLTRKYFRNPTTYLAIVFPLILITILPVSMPATMIYVGVMSIAVITQTLLSYGTSFNALRKSNFYGVLVTTRYNRKVLYTALFLFTFVVAYLIS